MRVSVALCTYNGAKYLREQLDSLAAQTRRPDEVVVGDDASSDDSVAIVEQWARETGIETKITRNEKSLGPTGNFEATIGRCTGEIVCPCDQDDVWLPAKIEKTVEPLERDPAVTFAICQSEICDEDLKSRGVTVFDDQRFDEPLRKLIREGDGFLAFRKHLVAPGHAIAFRVGVLPILFPFPTTCVHDQWIAMVASALGKTALIDEQLVRYRYHSLQITGGTQKSLTDWSAAQSTLKLDHLQRNLETWNALLSRARVKAIDNSTDQFYQRAVWGTNGKIWFLECRKRMRKGRFARTWRSLLLLFHGDYNRYGRGWLTFLRDLKG